MSRARLLADALRPPSARHRYGAHRCQQADLHLPAGDGPHPVAIVLHGGYWRATYGKRVVRPIAFDLARRGFATWNVEYRRIGRGQGGGWPATFEDVAAGIDHIATLDAPLDLANVTAIGHSAGGQLALWAATRTAPRVRVTRVVALAPVTDLVKTYRTMEGGVVEKLMGGPVEELPERYAAFDPIRQAPLDVPVLIVHPTADETVPIQRSRDYAHVAQEAGGDVQLVERPGGHRTLIDPGSEPWARVVAWL